MGAIRHDWQREEIMALNALPFIDLLFHAPDRRFYDAAVNG